MTQLRDSSRLQRVLAIARTDVRVRMARGSSVALLVALCILAYVIVPDISTGRALMQVNGHRALYNSSTIALATSSLCAVLLGMLGFYLISNTVRRDLVTRTGFVIASTPIRSAEYLAGKLLGNVAFLTLIVLVYLVNVMGMQLLRGEAPIEPLTYVLMFLAVVGPAVIVVSGFALVFECVRPLSGRAGDVAYFFVWAMLLSVPAASADATGGGAGAFADAFGMSFIINAAKGQTLRDFHGARPEISIGSSHFDPAQLPWRFEGVAWTSHVLATRLSAALLVVPLFLIAWWAFARFDPARVKGSSSGARTNVHGRMGAPIAHLLRVLRPASWAGPGLLRMTTGEMALTVMLNPLALLGAIAAAIAALIVHTTAMRSALIPIIFVGLIVTLADIPTRDRVARMDAIRAGIPEMERLSVVAKLLAALGISLAFLVVPLARVAAASPRDGLSLVIGASFLAFAAVALGTVARTPKLFAGIAMLFFYIVMSSPHAAEFDFAGWNGTATNGVRVAYFLAAIVLAFVAVLGDRYAAHAERG